MTGSTLMEQIFAIVHKEPPNPREFDLNIPEVVEKICLKALAKEKSERYPSATDMAKDVEEFLSGKIVKRKFTSRKRNLRKAHGVYHQNRKILNWVIYPLLAVILIFGGWEVYYQRAYNKALNLGEKFQEQRKYKKAYRQFKIAHNIFPKNPNTLIALVTVADKLGKDVEFLYGVERYLAQGHSYGSEMLYFLAKAKNLYQVCNRDKKVAQYHEKLINLCDKELKNFDTTTSLSETLQNLAFLSSYIDKYHKLEAFKAKCFQEVEQWKQAKKSWRLACLWGENSSASHVYKKNYLKLLVQLQEFSTIVSLGKTWFSDSDITADPEILRLLQKNFISAVVATRAADYYTLALQILQTNQIDQAYNEGSLLALTGKTNAAIEIWSQFPEDEKIACELGKLYAKQGNYPKALSYLESAKEKYPEDAEIFWLLSKAYKSNDYQESLKNLNRCIELEPWDYRYYKAKVNLQLDNGKDLESVESDFLRCLELKPDEVEIFQRMARLFFSLDAIGGAKNFTIGRSITTLEFQDVAIRDIFLVKNQQIASEILRTPHPKAQQVQLKDRKDDLKKLVELLSAKSSPMLIDFVVKSFSEYDWEESKSFLQSIRNEKLDHTIKMLERSILESGNSPRLISRTKKSLARYYILQDETALHEIYQLAIFQSRGFGFLQQILQNTDEKILVRYLAAKAISDLEEVPGYELLETNAGNDQLDYVSRVLSQVVLAEKEKENKNLSEILFRQQLTRDFIEKEESQYLIYVTMPHLPKACKKSLENLMRQPPESKVFRLVAAQRLRELGSNTNESIILDALEDDDYLVACWAYYNYWNTQKLPEKIVEPLLQKERFSIFSKTFQSGQPKEVQRTAALMLSYLFKNDKNSLQQKARKKIKDAKEKRDHVRGKFHKENNRTNGAQTPQWVIIRKEYDQAKKVVDELEKSFAENIAQTLDSKYSEALLSGVTHPDFFVQYQCSYNMGQARQDFLHTKIFEKDINIMIRIAVFNAAQARGDKAKDVKNKFKMLKLLQKALNHQDKDIRTFIRVQLGDLDMPPITKMINDNLDQKTLVKKLKNKKTSQYVFSDLSGSAMATISSSPTRVPMFMKDTEELLNSKLMNLSPRQIRSFRLKKSEIEHAKKVLLRAVVHNYTRAEKTQSSWQKNVAQTIEKHAKNPELIRICADAVSHTIHRHTESIVKEIQREGGRELSLDERFNWSKLYPRFIHMLIPVYESAMDISRDPDDEGHKQYKFYRRRWDNLERYLKGAIEIDQDPYRKFDLALFYFVTYHNALKKNFSPDNKNYRHWLDEAEDRLSKIHSKNPVHRQWLACVYRHKAMYEPRNSEYKNKVFRILDSLIQENPWNLYAWWEKYLLMVQLEFPRGSRISKMSPQLKDVWQKIQYLSYQQGVKPEYPYIKYANLWPWPKKEKVCENWHELFPSKKKKKK